MGILRQAICAALVLGLLEPALADAPVSLTLKDHKFAPAEIHVKANQPNLISLTNKDDGAEEFDSAALKVEKVVSGHATGEFRLRPLAPGRYDFEGEFNASTARGVVVAE